MNEGSGFRRYRVLLVEDEADLATTVATYLAGFEFDVEIAAAGSEAMAAFERARPDIVVLDLGLPDTDGRWLLSSFVAEGQLPVVLTSGRGDEVDKVVGLELGAVDYLTKPFSMRELLARLRAHLRFARTGASSSRQPHRLGPFVVDPQQRRVRHDDVPIELSEAELDLLLLLIEQPVVSRDEIARSVLRKPYHAGDRSVDQLVHRLRQRLGEVARGWGTLEAVRGIGYRLVPGVAG